VVQSYVVVVLDFFVELLDDVGFSDLVVEMVEDFVVLVSLVDVLQCLCQLLCI
jgi:hypothetical protein